MNVVYLRVSTDEQDVVNQLSGIQKYMDEHHMTIDRTIEETVSGSVEAEERLLASVLDKLKKGDTLIVSEISRIGRELFDVFTVMKIFNKKKCNFIAIKQNYHFKSDDIDSKIMLCSHTIMAEMERKLIRTRTKEALARLKASGKILGRKPKLERLMIDPTLSIEEIAKKNKVHRRTVVRYVRKHCKDLVHRKGNRYFMQAGVREEGKAKGYESGCVALQSVSPALFQGA